jgi:hypothetical protein
MRKGWRAVVVGVVLAAGIASLASGEGGLPEGVRGFSGQVRGVVAEKSGDNAFAFRVARVLQVWKNNKATVPELLGGLTVLVRPRWAQVDGGAWRPVASHVAFIAGLRAGQEMTLEIVNDEGERFAILELSGEQRERAGGGDGEKRERAVEREREGEGERREIRKDTGERQREGGGEREAKREREPERRDSGAESRERDREISGMKEDIRRLREENADLRREIREMMDRLPR